MNGVTQPLLSFLPDEGLCSSLLGSGVQFPSVSSRSSQTRDRKTIFVIGFDWVSMRRGISLYTCLVENTSPPLASGVAVRISLHNNVQTPCEKYKFVIDSKKFLVRRRQWHPTPVFLPGKSHGRRSLVGCSPWGRWDLDTTERLHFHLSLSCIGEGNGNPLQCSCLENPRDGGAWWAAVYGSHRVGHDWSDLAAAAAVFGKKTNGETVLMLRSTQLAWCPRRTEAETFQ